MHQSPTCRDSRASAATGGAHRLPAGSEVPVNKSIVAPTRFLSLVISVLRPETGRTQSPEHQPRQDKTRSFLFRDVFSVPKPVPDTQQPLNKCHRVCPRGLRLPARPARLVDPGRRGALLRLRSDIYSLGKAARAAAGGPHGGRPTHAPREQGAQAPGRWRGQQRPCP